MQKLLCKALTLTAAAVALGGGLFFAEPQIAEAKLLPSNYEEKQAQLLAESAEPQGSPEVPAQLTGESRSITLDEAMEMALANSPAVLAAQNDLASAKIDAQSAWSNSRSIRSLLGGKDDSHIPGSASASATDYYAVVVYAPEMYDQVVELYTYANDAQLAACKLQTIQAYYTVLCDGQAELSATYALEKARNQQNVVQARLDQGMATRLELLQANTQVNAAQTALDAARAKTVQDKRALSVTMGVDPETNWSPTTQLSFEPLLITDVEAKVQEMIKISPTVGVAEATYEVALINYNNAARLSHPNTYKGKQAKIALDTAEIQYQTAKRLAYNNAKSMLESLSLARKQYLIYQESQELLEEVYRLAVLQYENGLNTQNDIQAAAADLASNDSSRLNALLQYNIAKTAIEQGIVSTN